MRPSSKQIVRFVIPALMVGLVSISSHQLLETPKTWDEERIRSFQVPMADTSIKIEPISAEYYYALEERKLYKSYPLYVLDSLEMVEYIDSLISLGSIEYFPEALSEDDPELITIGQEVFRQPLIRIPWSPDILESIKSDLERSGAPLAANQQFPYFTLQIAEGDVPEIGLFSCAMCHTRIMPDGSIIEGAQGTYPMDRIDGFDMEARFEQVPENRKEKVAASMREGRKALQSAPWIDHTSQTSLDDYSVDEMAAFLKAIPPGVMIRHGSNFTAPANIPDLIGIGDRTFMDYTGLMMHESIGDLMRYAAFNQTLDMLTSYGGYIPSGIDHSRLPKPGKARFVGTRDRYSEAQLFALGKFLYSLEAPKSPYQPDSATYETGRMLFITEGCVTCHTPPFYTSNKITPVDGSLNPKAFRKPYRVFDVSVGTDPALALYTRRGTGYYKIPSLKGLWYRSPLGHSGHIATLEDWLDPARLENNYVPTGYKPPTVETMPVPGHEFGLSLSEDEKEALIAFLLTL